MQASCGAASGAYYTTTKVHLTIHLRMGHVPVKQLRSLISQIPGSAGEIEELLRCMDSRSGVISWPAFLAALERFTPTHASPEFNSGTGSLGENTAMLLTAFGHRQRLEARMEAGRLRSRGFNDPAFARGQAATAAAAGAGQPTKQPPAAAVPGAAGGASRSLPSTPRGQPPERPYSARRASGSGISAG